MITISSFTKVVNGRNRRSVCFFVASFCWVPRPSSRWSVGPVRTSGTATFWASKVESKFWGMMIFCVICFWIILQKNGWLRNIVKKKVFYQKKIIRRSFLELWILQEKRCSLAESNGCQLDHQILGFKPKGIPTTGYNSYTNSITPLLDPQTTSFSSWWFQLSWKI